MARHGWAPPGQRASVLGWNFSPRKGWSKPGETPDVNDLQFDMPIGQSPVGTGQGSGYSLLASPPGMQAPIDMPNYTPGTREVSAPGAMAPIDQLNLTAVPTQQGVPMPFDRSQLSPEDAVAELLAAYGIGGSVGTGEDDDKAGKLTQPTASPIKGPFDLAGDALGWIGDRIGEGLSPQRGVAVVPTGDEVAPLGRTIPMSDADADRLAALREAAGKKSAVGLPGEGEKTIVRQAEGFDARGNKVLYNIWSDGTASQVLGMVEPPQKRNTSIISLGGNQVMVDDETGEVVKNLGPSGTGPQGPQPQVVTGDDGKKYIVHPGTGAVTPLEGISTKPEFVPKGNKEYKRDAEGKLVLINEFEKEPTPFEFKTVGKKTYAVDPMDPFNPDFNKVIFEDTSPEFKTVGDKRIVKIDPKTGVPETVWTAPDEVRAIGSDIWIPKGVNAKINYKDVPAITPQNWSAPAMNWEKPKMGADDMYKWISGRGQDVGVGEDPGGLFSSDKKLDELMRLIQALREINQEDHPSGSQSRYTPAREGYPATPNYWRSVADSPEGKAARWGRPLTEEARAKFPEISKMLRGENPAPVEPRVPRMELGRMIGSPERLDPLAEGAGKGVSPGIERLAAAEMEARLAPEARAALNAWRKDVTRGQPILADPLELSRMLRRNARAEFRNRMWPGAELIGNIAENLPGPVQQAVGKAAQWARPVVDVVGKAAKWADPVLTPLAIIEGLANQLKANDKLSRGWSSAADVARESNPGWNLYPEEMRTGMERTRAGEVPTQDRDTLDFWSRFFGRGQDVGQGADRGDLSRLRDTGWTPPVPVPQLQGMGNKFGQPVDMEGTHKGTDLQAVQGTPAVAPVSGTVINVIFDPEGLGLQVVIQDEQGNKHKLSHLSDAMVKPGDQIQMGQPVGKVGSSGAGSTGPHLDYREQTPDGQYLNPEDRMGSLAQMPMSPNTVGAGQAGPPGWWPESIKDVGVGADGDGDLSVSPTGRYQADVGYQGILAQIDSQQRQMDQQYEIAKKQLENDRYKFDSEMEFNKAQQRLDEEYRRKAQDLEWNKFQTNWKYQQESERRGRSYDAYKMAMSNSWLGPLADMQPGWGEPGAPGYEGWQPTQPYQERDMTQMPDWQSLWDTSGQGPNADLPPMAGQELGGQQQLGSQVGGGTLDQPQDQRERQWSDHMWRGPVSPQGPPSITEQVGRNIGVQQPQGGGGQQQPTPTMGFDDWNKLSAFQQAGLRTKEMIKGPGFWENYRDRMRNEWGQGGVKQAPDVTQLSAAAANPAQQAAWGNTADVFGERPDQFWNRQNKGWSRAGRSDVSMTG